MLVHVVNLVDFAALTLLTVRSIQLGSLRTGCHQEGRVDATSFLVQ